MKQSPQFTLALACLTIMMDYVVTITSDWTHIIKEIDFVFGELFIYFFYCKKCGIMKTIGQGT